MPTLRKCVSDALVARGYKRLQRSVHLLPIDSDFSLWVDTGVVGLATDIAPSVGLRSDSVERVRSACMALPDYPTTVTVGANAGYVLGRSYAAWLSGANPEDVLITVFEALEVLRPFASVKALQGTFSIKGINGNPGTPYVAVVTALLQNDLPRIRLLLSEARRIFCVGADEVCEQFLEFERRVLDRTKEWPNQAL